MAGEREPDVQEVVREVVKAKINSAIAITFLLAMLISFSTRDLCVSANSNGNSIGVYFDRLCQQRVTAIDCGVYPGTTTVLETYIRNEGAEPLVLKLNSTSDADDRLEVTWNYTDSELSSGEIIPVEFYIRAADDMGDLKSFSIGVTIFYEYESPSPPLPPLPPSAPLSASSITVDLVVDIIKIGETVTVSGSITPSLAASVSLVYTRPDGSKIERKVNSGDDGTYTDLFTPDMVGSWGVTASWAGDAGHVGASSSPKAFAVGKLASSISVTVSPSVIQPNESIQIEGSISPSHVGVAVKLEYRRQDGEWVKIAETTTNEAGSYSYSWGATPSAVGIYEIRASWTGDSNHDGAESPVAAFSVGEKQTLTLSLSSNAVYVNESVTVYGALIPLHAYASITITIVAPNGAELVYPTSTDALGRYEIAFVPDSVGTWSVKSLWPGDADTPGCESSTVDLQVTAAGSRLITLQLSTQSLIWGNSLTFSGLVKPEQEGSTVLLTLTRPDSGTIDLETKSRADGTYSLSYTPDRAGIWFVQASCPEESKLSEAKSPLLSFTVRKKSTTLSLTVDPAVPKKGDLLTFKGRVDPSISGIRVSVLVSDDDGRFWTTIGVADTDSKGEYVVSWTADRTGTFCFRAEWDGDEEHSGTASNVLTLAIQEEVTRQSVVLPEGGETEVVLSSNSTTVSVKVDSTEGNIQIEVTGPEETKGILNIFVPDELLTSLAKTVEDLVFAVDGVVAEPAITKVSDGYLATLLYSHSTRTVSVHYLTYSIEVSVADYQGKPLPSATVSLTGPVRLSGVTDGAGVVHFTRVPRGRYVMAVHYGPKVGEASVDIVESRRLTVNTVYGKIEAEYAQLQQNYSDAQRDLKDLQSLEAEHQSLQIRYGELESEHESLQTEYSELGSEYESLKTTYEEASSRYNMLFNAVIFGAVIVAALVFSGIVVSRRHRGKALKP